MPAYLALSGGAYDLEFRNQAALILWWGLAIAFALGALPVARVHARLRIPLVGLALLVGLTALALTATESKERTFDELARVAGYAGVVVLVLSAVHRETFRRAAAGVVLAVLVIPPLALATRLMPDLFPDDSVARVFSGNRLLYPLDYWNALACWCAMACAAGLAWSAHSQSWQRTAALCAVPPAGAALFLTYSRAGVVVACFGVGLVLLCSRHRWTAALHAAAAAAATGILVIALAGQPEIADGTSTEGAWAVWLALAVAIGVCWATATVTRRWTVDRLQASARLPGKLVLALTAAAVVAMVIIGPRVVSQAEQSFTGSGVVADQSNTPARLVSLGGSRTEVWSSAVRAFESDPLAGIGPGAFDLWWVRDTAGGEDLHDAHSLYLETLAELGIPGLAALLVFAGGLLAAAIAAMRRLKRGADLGAALAMVAVGAIFLLHAGVDWLWEMGALAAVGLAALAIAAAAGSERHRSRDGLGWRRVALVLIAVAAGAVQIPGLVATQRLDDSARLLTIGLDERAAELAGDAVDAEPWAAAPHAQSALVQLASEHDHAAKVEIEKAIEREPTNWRHRFLQVRIELARGDEEAASAALAATVELNPALAGDAELIRDTTGIP